MDEDRLVAVLEEARGRGLTGPGPVQAHLDHARGFEAAIGSRRRGLFVDLGSGAGIPGLVLAVRWPQTRWLLVDASGRSTEFLREACAGLGVGDRVTVVQGRAEELGRDVGYRGTAATVTARGFGAPAVTAECAGGLLAPGGCLVVSEPPDPDPRRWPSSGLGELGQRLVNRPDTPGAHFVVIEQVAPIPDRYPRRTGVPARRPLF